ncbi:MAG TPA: N-acetylmuramoyl-L-alanine amidase, partial [Kofleriaceae bacterium]|nr:N-acetylmuramoyl-L-alanine amidase [Kofleriaceae bacterium]
MLAASLLLCAYDTASADVPLRWRTGAALDADRSGDLRAEAAALIDRVQASSAVVTVPRRRAAAALPESIRVWRRAIDGSTSSCAGRVDVIPFEQYVRGVLPHEWISSWHENSLKAGAVAIRTYAAAWVAAGGKYDCADLDDTTASQVYRDEFVAATDAAVRATEGVHLVDDAGDLVFAEYSAENGDPTEFGVDEPLCTGHEVFGHGRGTCQWGTQRWASEEGKPWKWIALHYYPGATLAGITVALDAALAGESYPLEMTSGEQVVVWLEYDNLGARTWNDADTLVGTTGPRDRASAFAAADWISPSRPTAADAAGVETGTTGRFSFTLRAPEVEETTVFTEQFGLVTSGGRWFGPADVTWSITVKPAAGDSSDPDGDPPPATPDEQADTTMGGGCAAAGSASWILGLGLLFFLARVRRSLTALVLALAVFTGCADIQDRGGDPAPVETGDGLGGESALVDLFREASSVTGVPASIIAAVSYGETRLRFVDSDDHAHGAPAIGLMALSQGGVRDAARAAELAGVSEAAVYSDPRASVLAGAALLADLAGPSRDWRAALAAYGADVDDHLARGFRGLDAEKKWLVLSARLLPGDPGGGIGSSQHAVGFPGAIWNPAYSGNYQAASRGASQINYVIIHTTQGSYSGTISWFKNSSSNVSAHYVVRSSDGERTQMVDDSDVAWHDACFNSETIGIEHEGFVSDPDTWYTEAMYTKSAELTAWLCDQYGIPKDRDHIFGHGEAPDCSDHTDPGSGWKWAHYMDLVQGGGEPVFDANYVNQDT